MPRGLIQNRASETPPNEADYDSGLNILFLAAFPLFAWLFQGSFAGITIAFFQLWLLSVALRLVANGQRQQLKYDATPGARAPRVPRKLLGAVILGLLVMLLAGHHFHSVFIILLLGAVGTVLAIAAFGIDPLQDKPAAEMQQTTDTNHQAEMVLDMADHALAQIADRVAMLEDAELTRRTEAARTLVIRVLRSFARDPHSLLRLQRPVEKFIRLLDTEANRLCSGDASESSAFARRRYIAKLEVMTESFDGSARKTRVRGDKDAFELEADLLLNRMPQNNAA